MRNLTKNYKNSANVAYNIAGNFIQGFITLILIPITTKILDAEDYGIFGIGLVILNLSTAICETGSSYLIYAYIQKISHKRRCELFSTFILMAGIIGCIVSAILYSIWILLRAELEFFSQFSELEIVLVCAAIPLRAIWIVAVPILVSVKKSRVIAISLISQSALNFCIVTTSLFILDLGRLSLFIGNTASNLISIMICIIYLGKFYIARPRLFWIKKSKSIALGAWCAGVIESCRAVLESALLQKFVGISLLGSFFHARLYQGMIMQGTNAFNNVLWPLALEESKIKSSSFKAVRDGWNFAYFGITVIGLLSAFYGFEIVGYISNNKFNAASSWIPWLVIYSLIQNSGKPATAVLFHSNKGNLLSKIRIILLVLDMIALYFLVPYYGIESVIAISIFDMLFMRFIIRISADKIQKIPFTDWMIVLGIFLIIFGIFFGDNFSNSIEKILVLCFLVSIDLILLIYFNKQN